MNEHQWSPMAEPDPEAGSWAGLERARLSDMHALMEHAVYLTRGHGDVSPERSYHAAIKTDQAPPRAASPAPDPFTGDQHAVRKGHNRKGSTRKVVGRGTSYVSGPDPVTGRDMVRLPGSVLASIADAWAAREGVDLEPLMGTDNLAFSEVIHAGVGAVDAYGVARHRADVTDGLAGLPRQAVAAFRLRAVYGAETGEDSYGRQMVRPELASWPTRLVVRRMGRPRTSDPVDVTTVHAPEPGAEGPTAIVTRLVAASADRERLFVGHAAVRRSGGRSGTSQATPDADAARVAADAVKLAARRADASPEELAIADALSVEDDGDVAVSLPGVTITVRRHTFGPMAVTMVRGAETITFRARTAAAIARRAIA